MARIIHRSRLVPTLTALIFFTTLAILSRTGNGDEHSGSGYSVMLRAGPPNKLPVGTTTNITASVDPGPDDAQTLAIYAGSTDGYPIATTQVGGSSGTSSLTTQVSSSSPGTQPFIATCGSATPASQPVTWIGIDKLQYNNGTGYVDAGGTLYVLKGTTITFKAIANPAAAGWPTGNPVWGGTSGASGSGSTVGVDFNTVSSSASDYKTITATCGSSTITQSAIVFDFTPKVTAVDNFIGRSNTALGIGEVAHLSATITPNLPPAALGNWTWTLLSGSGSLTDNGDSTGTIVAPESSGNMEMQLSQVSPATSQPTTKDVAQQIKEPQSGILEKSANTFIWHEQNIASVGFEGTIYLSPKDVSFSAIQFREDTCPADLAGTYSDMYPTPPGHPHMATTQPLDVTSGDQDGPRVNGVDTISTTLGDGSGTPGNPVFKDGSSLKWAIPWEYKINNGAWKKFDTANHEADIDATGRATISKKGVGPFHKDFGEISTDY